MTEDSFNSINGLQIQQEDSSEDLAVSKFEWLFAIYLSFHHTDISKIFYKIISCIVSYIYKYNY